jgi:hypothetical protein
MKKIATLVMSLAIGLLSLNTVHAAPGKSVQGQDDRIYEILLATFGGANERERCDAVEKVAGACVGKVSCVLPAMKEMCGRPNQKEVRKLTVLYRCATVSRLAVANENESVELQCRNQ